MRFLDSKERVDIGKKERKREKKKTIVSTTLK